MNNSAVYLNDELMWLNRASMFERKFVTDHGVWYGDVLYPNLNGR